MPTPASAQLDQRFDQRQIQTLTPRLQYAVRLLQLSALDYEQELHEVIEKNPFLEIDESAASPTTFPEAALSPPVQATESESGAATDGAGVGDGDGDREAIWEQDREQDSWLHSPGTMRDGAKESQSSALDLMVADADLRQHLHGQANLLPLSARDHALLCAVIESLDDDGYLRQRLDDIGAVADLDPRPDACELNTALRLVQSFDPAGIGARSVAECLLLQIDRLDAHLRDVGRRIVAEQLERLAQRDIPGLARLLGRPPDEIEAACAALRRLDPRPGWRFTRSDAQYVTPDVIARKLRGKWVVQLNATLVPQLRLNRSYAELFQRHRDAGHAQLGLHLQEARWTLRNVEQRFSTILAVSKAILRRQYPFFEYGPLAMKPLALRDIAEEIGVHESTVCRVTNNKYMATPSGLFELKHFFSRPMPMASGGACSATAIRSVVKELIDAEDPHSPISDVEIARRLARQGLTVARRTVTKYRQGLKIAPAERRRVHAGA